jgi:hypothetical protein
VALSTTVVQVANTVHVSYSDFFVLLSIALVVAEPNVTKLTVIACSF